MYVYLNVSKQMTDVKLLLLIAILETIQLWAKNRWDQARLKMLSIKWVYKSYLIHMYKED